MLFQTYLTFVSLITMSIALPSPRPSFEARDCGKSNAIMRFNEISVKPDPVYFDEPGLSTIVYNILEDLPQDAFFKVDIWRGNRVNEENLSDEERTPCIFGLTCEIPICDWMRLEYNSCMSYHNSTSYCSCPVKAGLRPDIEERFSLTPSYIFPAWFKPGTYTSKFTIMDGSRKELGCFLMSGTVASRKN